MLENIYVVIGEEVIVEGEGQANQCPADNYRQPKLRVRVIFESPGKHGDTIVLDSSQRKEVMSDMLWLVVTQTKRR